MISNSVNETAPLVSIHVAPHIFPLHQMFADGKKRRFANVVDINNEFNDS